MQILEMPEQRETKTLIATCCYAHTETENPHEKRETSSCRQNLSVVRRGLDLLHCAHCTEIIIDERKPPLYDKNWRLVERTLTSQKS